MQSSNLLNQIDTCVTIAPYFKIHQNKLEQFNRITERFIKQTSSESGVLFYGFSFCEDIAHCREGYLDAEAVLNHLNNVGNLLEEVLTISDIVKLEIHGPETELEKLVVPLENLKPVYFRLGLSFRK